MINLKKNDFTDIPIHIYNLKLKNCLALSRIRNFNWDQGFVFKIYPRGIIEVQCG